MKKWYQLGIVMLLLLFLHDRLKAQGCNGCTTTISALSVSSYTVNAGEVLCISATGTIMGSITCNGGTICNQGTINTASFTVNGGTINNYGTIIVRGSLVLVNTSILNNFDGLVKISCDLLTDATSYYNSTSDGKILVAPFPTVEVLATNTSICSGTNVSLKATGATSYTWLPETGLNTTTGDVVIANPSTTTTYTVIGESTDGCRGGTTSITIIVNGLSPFAGTFTIGGTNPDYPTITAAINDLKTCKQLTDAVILQVRDGVYNESILLDETINIQKLTDDIPIYFAPDNLEDPNVVIEQGQHVVDISGKKHIYVGGFVFRTTQAGQDAIRVANSESIVLKNIEVLNTATNPGNRAISLSQSNTVELQQLNISGYNTGVGVENTIAVNVISTTINAVNRPIDFLSCSDLLVENNILNAATLSTGQDLTFDGTQGGIYVASNTFNGKGNNLVLKNHLGKTIIRGNQINKSDDGVGIFIESFGNELLILENDIIGSTASGIRLKDNTTASDLLDNTTGKFIMIGSNQLNVGQTALQFNRIKNTKGMVWNNKINASQVGIDVNSAIYGADIQMDIIGNLIVSTNKGLSLSNNQLSTNIRSNTVVVVGAGSSKSVELIGTDNLLIHANNIVNNGGLAVATFDSYNPSNITVTQNNWYSTQTGAITNRSDIVLSTGNLQQDPKFKENEYTLSTQSPLLDVVSSNYDNYIWHDLAGSPRYINYDIGAFESASTGIDKLPFSIVLDKNIVFYPNNSPGSYNQFVINGLNNFSTVSLKVFDKDDVMVYQSDSKTDFWNGVNMNTGSTVNEGMYSYELVLDNTQTKGIVYVKP